MTTHQRLPIGAVGGTSTTPPRYVPHAPALYAPPLSEADTWPSVPRYPINPRGPGQPAPRRVSLTPAPMAAIPVRPISRRAIWRPRHTRLGWRIRAVGWSLVDLWGEMRLWGGWLGEVAFLAIVAGMGAGVVVGVLLLWFWLTSGLLGR